MCDRSVIIVSAPSRIAHVIGQLKVVLASYDDVVPVNSDHCISVRSVLFVNHAQGVSGMLGDSIPH